MEHSFTKGAHVTAHAEKNGAKRVGYEKFMKSQYISTKLVLTMIQ